MKSGCVYIVTNKRNGTIYIGSTSNLPGRIYQHKNGFVESFSKKYGLTILVWYQYFDDLQEARRRELQMKKWERPWKLRVIEEMNPRWEDLYETLF